MSACCHLFGLFSDVCRVRSLPFYNAAMQLSPTFYSERARPFGDRGRTNGIDNTPPPEIVENLKRLAAGLETVRALLGAPLEISSGYRCAALNEAVGGSGASQHLLGLAVDFACPGFGTPLEVARRDPGIGLAVRPVHSGIRPLGASVLRRRAAASHPDHLRRRRKVTSRGSGTKQGKQIA